MIWSLLSYVRIRVSVILSLGIRFSLAGSRSLGVALEVCRLVFLHPAVISCLSLGVPWSGFDFSSVWRTWTNQPLVCISIYLVLFVVEPRACQSLGVAWFTDPCGICYILLWFGSVSLSLDLGFEFHPLLCWLSISGLGFQFRWVYAVVLTWSLPRVSLSIGLKNLIGSLIVDWAFANQYSI